MLVGRFREVESNVHFVKVPLATLLLDFFSSWTIVVGFSMIGIRH